MVNYSLYSVKGSQKQQPTRQLGREEKPSRHEDSQKDPRHPKAARARQGGTKKQNNQDRTKPPKAEQHQTEQGPTRRAKTEQERGGDQHPKTTPKTKTKTTHGKEKDDQKQKQRKKTQQTTRRGTQPQQEAPKPGRTESPTRATGGTQNTEEYPTHRHIFLTHKERTTLALNTPL